MQSLQSLSNWIQLHTLEPHQCALNFTEQIARAHFLLLQPSIRPISAQVILLWKGPPKLCIECHLVPLERSRQNHLVGFVNNLFDCQWRRVSCMRQTTLTQSRAPGRVIGWTNFSHQHSEHGFCRNFQFFTGFVSHLFCSFYWVLSFL